jgi:predicted nuclease of predicted toxin-antitoxin system
VKVLLDENLSPTLVQLLGTKGIAAEHVAYVGLSGKSDAEVWNYAYAHDQVVVTINASDFIRLASGVALHPGLIIMRARGLSRGGHWQWLEAVIDFLQSSSEDLVNKAVEITGPGIFNLRDLPAP